MPWLRHGFLNTLEHGLTRALDAVISLVLLWALPTEIFSQLALAQAWVAPVLLVFVTPETVIYRDFAGWKSRGSSEIAARLRALRLFGWGKGQLGVLISAVAAIGDASRGWALLWAFALALGPQIAGADREFLRMRLKLVELNSLSLYQKLSLAVGTVLATFALGGQLWAIAAAAVFSVFSSAVMAKWITRRVLIEDGASAASLAGREGPPVLSTISDALVRFSGWQHASGVVQNWVQTMDLFFLGAVGSATGLLARDLGLYASVLKLAGLTGALPTALTNSFQVWLAQETGEGSRRQNERKRLPRFAAMLFAATLLQAAVLIWVSPWILTWLSHGRWSSEEVGQMISWLKWILAGNALFFTLVLPASWLLLRTSVRGLFLRLSLPWLAFSIAAYGLSAWFWGLSGAAMANIPVALVYGILLLPLLNRRDAR